MQPAVSETKAIRPILVALNEDGRRIGETHHNSRLSDAFVEKLRDLHEYEGKTPRQIADHLQISFRTVKKICYYQRRVQVARSWKRIVSRPDPITGSMKEEE